MGEGLLSMRAWTAAILMLPCLCAGGNDFWRLGDIPRGMPHPFLWDSFFGDWEAPQFTAPDSLRLDVHVLDSMAVKLGADLTVHHENRRCYERRLLSIKTYGYCFAVEWPAAALDTLVSDTLDWGIDTVRLEKNRIFSRYRFEASLGENTWSDSGFTRFLNSAYHQELFPGYRRADSLFQNPPAQPNQWGLWSRGALSMGWAAGYALKHNPTVAESKQKILWYYAADAYFVLLASALTAGAVYRGEPEKIPMGLVVLKGVYTALGLGIALPILSIDLGEWGKVRKSGYRMPRAAMRK